MPFFRPRNRHFLLLDIVLLTLIPITALGLRVESSAWTAKYAPALLVYTVLALVIKIGRAHV